MDVEENANDKQAKLSCRTMERFLIGDRKYPRKWGGDEDKRTLKF